MSLYVSITRRAEPLAEDGPTITSQEWLDCVGGEPDFRVPEGGELKWVGPIARVWSGHGEYPVVFDWVDGQVDVKNPDERTVARMKRLATKLAANVVSETGEIFRESGESAGFLPGYP